MGKSTADAATAKLFGAPSRAPKAPSSAVPPPATLADKAPALRGAEASPTPAPRPAAPKQAAAASALPKRGAAKPTGVVATEPARRAPAADDARNTGNYLGRSLYLYKGVEARKLSVYVEPSLAAGLRMAAASGADPRGSDMSEIVGALLRENGYADWRPPTP